MGCQSSAKVHIQQQRCRERGDNELFITLVLKVGWFVGWLVDCSSVLSTNFKQQKG